MTFSQISSLFEQAQATQPWAKDLTFEQFAAMGAQATGDQEMQRISQAGSVENTVRGLNQGLTEMVNATPLDEWLGNFTGFLGEAVGVDKQAATAVGQSLPRQVANIAPYFIPYVGPYVSAGLSAVDTYDQTGSTWQAGISAIAPAAVSKAATAGGNALLQAAAKSPTMQKLGVTGATTLAPRLTNIGLRGQDLPIGSAIQDTVVRGLANKATKFTGEAIAGQAAGLGLDVAAQGFDAVANKEYLFANLIGNLAFSPLNIPDFIGTKVVSSKEIIPDKFDPIFTPEQKRAFDFESLIKSLDPTEQTRMAKASGFDIAQQYLTEQTLSNLDSEYTTARTEARQKLESDWQALRTENPNIPELSSIKKPDDVPLELYTTARTRYDEYDMLVRKLNQEERAKVKSALVKPNVMSLQKVAMDDLQLPEKLLGKPVADRTLKDYEDVLTGQLSDRGIKVIYSMHKRAAGLEVEEIVKPLADEVEKMLRKEPTAFAEDRAFVAASLWALGERPTPLKVVKERVEKKVKEGEKVSKAVASVNKKDAARAVKKVRGADKKKRKVNEAVTQRVEGIEQEVKQAGEAADARKANEEQKILLDAYRYASEQSGGDEATFRAMMSSLSKVWSSGKSKEDKLKEFKGKVQTILQNKQATRERKEIVGLDEARLTKEEVQETELKDFENDTDTDGEGFVDEMLEDEAVTESAQVVSQDKAIEKEMLRLVMDNRDLGVEQAREFLNMLSPEKTKALWKIAEANITAKFARNADENIPQVGLQQTMSFDKWADVLLENEGFTARETQELKEHFAKVVELFYSPEVKYGFLDEFPLESKLAKGYIGVVGEGGVRWKFGELNQMVHDDYPELKARLAETKFRYRDDNQTLYKWGHITEVEMENIKAKLAKLGKEVKTVKLITTGNVAEAHGITTLFGPEPGQKVKWARASAGGGFDFALGEVQGGKLLRPGKGAVTLAKDGTLSVQELKVAGGQFGPLQDGEVQFYKELVPEAFSGDRVNVKMLWEKLNTLGEQVKVVTYGQGSNTVDHNAVVGHWLDSQANFEQDMQQLPGEDIINIITGEPATEAELRQAGASQEVIDSWNARIDQQTGAEQDVARDKLQATSYYNQISPFDTKKYPVLRVDVVLPEQLSYDPKLTEAQQADWADLYQRQYSPSFTAEERQRMTWYTEKGNKRKKADLWQQDNLHENLPNTLGWAMVQIVPHPVTGEKVMFVGEAQSRWGQQVQKLGAKKNIPFTNFATWAQSKGLSESQQTKLWTEQSPADPTWAEWRKFADDMAADAGRPQGHPLLPIHQNLILKSVIKEAQKQGISKVAVSDGETAMMTEGHDKAHILENVFTYRTEAEARQDQSVAQGAEVRKTPQGWWEVIPKQRLSQEGGMRLAYDTTMPSIMKKLVGEGTMEDFGVHKNAERGAFEPNPPSNDPNILAGESWNPDAVKGSPVFRTPSGTPKTNATARVYDITNPSERVNTLFARKPIPGSTTYAAAVESTRQVFLNPKALEGLSPLDKVRVQASLAAHELSHILIYKARNNAFGPEAKALVDEMEAWVQTANPQDVDVVVETMADVFLDKRTRGLPGVEDVIKNLRDNRGQLDKDEVLANMYGIWATGLHQVKDPGRFYTLLPRVVRDMFDWVAEKVQGVVRAAQMYVKFGGDQAKLKQVQNVRDVFAAVRRGARKAEENLSELNELANLNQADVVDFAEAKFAKGVYGGSGKTRSVVENWADNWLVRLGSLAATYEGLKKPYLAMVDTMPLTADLTAQALAGLGWGDYSYTGLVFKKGSATARIHKSKPLHRLASKINVELNKMADVAVVEENGKYKFDTSKLSPEVKGELAAFAPDAQAAVAEYFIKRSKESMPVVHGTIVGKEWEAQRDMVHLSLVNLSEFKTEGGYKKAEVLAEQLMQKARQGDDAGVEELLAQMQDKVDADKFGKYLRGVVSDLRELEADYKKNPAFGSLRRFQPIHQKWTKGNEVKNMQARTAKEAEEKAAWYTERGYKPGRVIITDYKHKGEWVMEGASKQRLKDREDRLKALIDDLPIDETVRNELKEEVSFVQQLETDEAAQSVFSTSVKRNFAEGVEELDVLEQDILFASKAISAANKKALRSKVKVSMLNPELDQHLDAKNTFEQAYQNFNSQNHDLLRKMSKANAAYFIGFNLPGHIAELMQPVMTHLAEMRNIGLGALESLGVIKGSSSDVFDFYKRNLKKFAKREEVHIWDDWSNPEEKEMLQEFKHVINANPLDYAFDEMGFRQQQLMEATEVGKPKTLAQLVASPAVAYGNMGLKFYNLFTRHNAIIGLLGGYRAYRKAGLSHQEAKEKVRLYEVVVNKSGGRADRQASPFKGNALLGHLFYGLQGYTTGWFSQLLTYFRHGYLSKDYAGFKDNPQAVKNARKALWTMLGAQLGAAGLMGMPFVGALTALYEEFSGDDLRGDIYESLDEVTNDPLLTQAASHGVASALAERLGIPADLHSRFAIGGLLGFNSYDGFSASSLLGPTAGMVNSLWNMGSTFSQERDLRKALDAGGPTGLRSIAKALDEELPLRGESRLGTLLGFKSSNIRKEQEFERIAQKRNEKAARDVSHAARRIQENLGRGSQYVQAKVIEEAKKLLGEDQSPEAMKSMISKLASKVRQYEEEKRLPPDLRRTATAQTAEPLGQLARAMGVNLPQSQEVDRELLKQGVYRLMGLPTRSRLTSAYQTDLETAQDPYSFR